MYSLITDTPPTGLDNFIVEMLEAISDVPVRAMMVIHLTDDPSNPYLVSQYNATASDWAAAAGYCNLEAAAALQEAEI